MIRFTVFGEPKPAGSKRAFWKAGTKFARVVEDNEKAQVWKESVSREAARAMNGAPLLLGAVRLDVTFVRLRPKDHFRANGTLKPNAPPFPFKKPDRTKLLRGLEDALKGICWRDDGQVCGGETRKVFGEPVRVEVTIAELKPEVQTIAKTGGLPL